MNIKKVEWLYDPIETDKKLSYKVTTQKDVIWFVPFDESNSNYQAVQQWVAEGNTIEE
tara:strand:+ start:591 stop:764 length:174 start_codon:yes stop_codon:yes gene_type:complete